MNGHAPAGAWPVIRSIVRWTLAWGYFVPTALFAILLALFDHRRVDMIGRAMMRPVLWFAGARLRTKYSDGYQRGRTAFFVMNHVNIFDPFFTMIGMPPLTRALELESHFKMPVYGWLMKRYGNVPVPDERSASALKRTYRMAKERLDEGIPLLVFAEGGRTLDGKVGPFELGVFRMAHQLGYPIVPVSLVGAYRFKRKGSFVLTPGPVTMIFHDTIETKDLDRKNLKELRDRVREIIAAPVHEELDQ